MADAPGNLLVVSKTYDLIKWACQHISNFPRGYRVTLGDRIELRLYDVLDLLIEARYTRERNEMLRRVNLWLEMLRFQFRLAHELRCLTKKPYEFGVVCINEIGMMVGGWIRKGSAPKTSEGRP